jgi:hypothetical protein
LCSPARRESVKVAKAVASRLSDFGFGNEVCAKESYRSGLRICHFKPRAETAFTDGKRRAARRRTTALLDATAPELTVELATMRSSSRLNGA